MKKTYSVSGVGYCYFIFSVLFVLLANLHSSAQNLRLSDFVVYANSDTASENILPDVLLKNYGVEIHSNSNILSGSVGSGYSVRTTGPVKLYGDIHSANNIILALNNIVKGNITVANKNNIADKNSFRSYDGFSLNGNLDINGNIFINKQAKINGTVTHPEGTNYNGPVPSGGEVIQEPSIPALPANAKITNFQPAGKMNITGNETITPGRYGTIKLNGNNTITFSGPGIYTFRSISNYGDLNKFVFDFKNSPDGVFELQVYGDVNLGKF